MRRLFYYIPLFLHAFAVAAEQEVGVQPDLLSPYFKYQQQYPKIFFPLGDANRGEIEIILDKKAISEIEKKTGRKVGVIGEDTYWLWINDAVKFPSGKQGVYGRILWRQSLTGPTGVAVMALLPNAKILLNCNFRHATRSWEYELPRGGVQPNETIEEAALREVREETGMVIDKLHLLGHMAPDSGVMNTIVPVFLAEVIAEEKATPEDSEAIDAVESFTVEELKKGFIDGFLIAKIQGKEQKIPLRDPFLAFALLQAELRQLLPKIDARP